MLRLPRLYPILDRACFDLGIAERWMRAGLPWIQYRNKSASDAEMLAEMREVVRLAYALQVREKLTLISNDRADLCLAAGFDGVHLGQEDLSPNGARRVVGSKIIGFSCHDESQIAEGEEAAADYLAIGPIFATGSKRNPDPVIGLERLRSIRTLTKKPLVAIGGITRENCAAVWDTGADSVAVIADLARDPERDLAAWLRLL